MKRKVSLFVAAVMLVSMLPTTSAFAATKNDALNSGGTTATDKDWSKDILNAPTLQISKDGANSLPVGSKFKINLTNAVWSLDDREQQYVNLGTGATFYSSSLSTSSGAAKADSNSVELGYYGNIAVTSKGTAASFSRANGSPYAMENTNDSYSIQFNTQNSAEVTITAGATSGGNAGSISRVYIPMLVKMQGAGAATVQLSELSNSNVSPATYTFATGTEGGITTTVAAKKNTAGDFEVPQITITETVAGKIELTPSNYIALRAPSGFTWGEKNTTQSNVDTGFSGGFNSAAQRTGNWVVDSSDKGLIKYVFNAGYVPTSKSTNMPGTITITKLKLFKDDDAALGPMTVRAEVSGAGSSEVVIGDYIKRTVSMVAEDKTIPEIVSGTYTKDAIKDENKTLKLTIKEGVRGAWNVSEGQIVLMPNDGVKFRGAKITNSKHLAGLPTDELRLQNVSGAVSSAPSSNPKIYLKDNKLTIKGGLTRTNSTDAAEMEIQFYVTVKPGYEGDIIISSHPDDNDAFAGQVSATIAKAVNPLTFSATNTQIPLGKTGIKLADITVKENKAGALMKSEQNDNYGYGIPAGSTDKNGYELYDNYNFWIGSSNSGVGINDEVAKAEVVSGNVIVDEVKTSSVGTGTYGDIKPLVLKIKRTSTTPSEVKLTGLTADTRRDLADGEYDLRVNGLLTANYKGKATNSDLGSFDVSYVTAVKNYVAINGGGSPMNPSGKSSVTSKIIFKIGSTAYTVDAKEATSPVAPFISNNSAYVPIRPIMDIMGLQDKDYQFDKNTKTLTLYNTPKGTVQMQAGATEMLINGAKVAADEVTPVAIQIKQDRIFVPFRAIGKLVIDCPVGYEQATQEISYN